MHRWAIMWSMLPFWVSLVRSNEGFRDIFPLLAGSILGSVNERVRGWLQGWRKTGVLALTASFRHPGGLLFLWVSPQHFPPPPFATVIPGAIDCSFQICFLHLPRISLATPFRITSQLVPPPQRSGATGQEPSSELLSTDTSNLLFLFPWCRNGSCFL